MKTSDALRSFGTLQRWWKDECCAEKAAPLRCDGMRHEVGEIQRYAHVETGYRVNVRTIPQCLGTLFMLHNETINVWSHLLGFLWFLAALVEHLDSPPVMASAIATAACMLLSTSFHLFQCCVSDHGARCLLCADQSGIALATFGNTMSGLYVAFSCTPTVRNIYMFADLAVIFGLAAAKRVGVEVNNVIALVLFAGIGLVPAIHWLCFAGTDVQLHAAGGYVAMMWVWFAVGLSFYTTHWPERQFPKRFDNFGASHQLFHISVFLGLRSIYLGIEAVAEMPLHVMCGL